MAEVENLWVTLSAITAPFAAGLAEAGGVADEFIAQLAAMKVAAAEAGVSLAAVGSEGAAGGAEAAAGMERAAVAADGQAAATERAAVATRASSTAAKEAAASQDLLGSKVLGLGKVLDGVTKFGALGIAGITAESLKMSAGFDAATTRWTTQAGLSTAQTKELSAGVLKLAGKVGFDPDSLAEAMFHVASNMGTLGASSAQMLEVTKVAAEGAAVGGANLVDVTNALTAVVAAGIPGVKDYSQAMGVLNATVGIGDMTMQDLADSMGSGMVATVKGFGLTIQDVGSALAVFGDNNIRGAVAGTDLRMTVQALAKPARDAGVYLEKFGWTSSHLADDMRKGGLKLALEDLQAAFKKNGIEADQQGQVITEMFGKKAGSGLNVLLDQMDRLESKYPALNEGANGFGNAWVQTKQTLAQQLKDIRAGFDSTMVRLGEHLTPEVSKLISLIEGKGAPVVRGFVDALRGISQGFTGRTSASEGKTATTSGGEQHGGPVTVAPLTPMQELGKTLRGVSDDIGKFVDAGRHLADVLLKEVIPQVEKIGGAAIVGGLMVVGQILANVVAPAMKDFADFAEKHKTIMTWIIDGFLIPLTLRLTLLATVKTVSAVAGLAKDIVSFPFSQAKQILEQLDGIKTSVSGSKTMSIVQSIGGGLKQAGSTIASTVSGWGASIGSAVKGVMPTRLDAQLFLQSVKDTGAEVGSRISGWASSAVSAAQSVGSKIASGLSTGLSTLGAQSARIWQSLGSAVASAGNAARGAIEWLVASGRAAYEAGVKALVAAGAWLAEKVQLVATAVAEGLAAAGEWLLNVALDANPIMLIVLAIAALVGAIIYAWNHFAWFRTAVLATWELIGGSALWLWHQVLEPFFHGIADVALWLWRDVMVPAWNGITGAISQAIGWISGVPGQIGRLFSDAGTWLWNAGYNIMLGLWNGIKSMGSWVAQQVGSLIADVIPGPVRKILDMKSPSRVMHQLGLFVSQGLAQGITAGAALPAEASRRMALGTAAAGALTIGSSAGVSGLAVGARASDGGGSSGQQLQPIVVNVDGRKLFEVMQVQALRNNRRNPTSGLALT